MSVFDGFKKFILRGNVVDLAVGVVIGGAFSALVNSLVKDLLTPLISAIGGNTNFSSISFSLRNSKFMVGNFLNNAISFLIMSAVIYFFVVLPINKLATIGQKNEKKELTSRKCPECFSDVPIKAKRCPFCTSIIKPLNKA